MRVREATLEDVDDLLAMARLFAQDSAYGRFFPRCEAQVGKYLMFTLEKGAVLVYEIEGIGLIGMIGVALLDNVDDDVLGERIAQETAWWVLPAYRGAMVGPRLLEAAEDCATRKGASVLKLSSPAGSDVGAFLERRGFLALETVYVKRLGA